MPKGANIKGYEFTKVGMKAYFKQMGYPDITTGEIVDKKVTIDPVELEKQGFMPILTNSGSSKESGHWIMLFKGPDNKYFLYDPFGKASGTSFQKDILAKLPQDPVPTLDVLPVESGLHKGMTGYWVASAGMMAHANMNQKPTPTLEVLGSHVSNRMKQDTSGWSLQSLKNFLAAIADGFKTTAQDPTRPVTGDALRDRIERFEVAKDKKPTTSREWDDFSLYSDGVVRQAIDFANTHYLSTPFVEGRMEATPMYTAGNIKVNRSNHGLAHTIRTMAYAEIIVEEARKGKVRGDKMYVFPDKRTLGDITPQDMRKIMIAQAFFVAGREGEESVSPFYQQYHKKSREAFERFVEENKGTLIPDVFKDEADVKHYADIVEDLEDVNGKKMRGASLEHMLVNQCHMVDLMRCKSPAEPALESFYGHLSEIIGTKGADAVFGIQRKFFLATGEALQGNDPNSDSDYEIPYSTYRYVMEKDESGIEKPLRHPNGQLQKIDNKIDLKPNQRNMKVRDYYKLPEVIAKYPGHDKVLENPFAKMNTMDALNALSSKNRGMCETNVQYCLDKLKEVRVQSKSSTREETFEKATQKERRGPNPDEVAAAKIIKQILADPENIKDDHVMLNGQRLDEQFFRGLLKKCDMAVVGKLLDSTDMANVNKLMAHEKNTLFREPGDGVVAEREIGKEWQENYLPNNRHNVGEALVHMMQDGSWYYRRLNAVAQGRDSGSSFKEVMLTALLVPATRKALVDNQPRHRVDPPKSVFRGMMDMPESFKRSLMEQSEAIIAHSGVGMFTDPRAELYQQMQVNHFTHVFGKTCLSTASNEAGASAFGSDSPGHNIMVQIDDPDGVLDAQRVVQRDDPNAENEYSVYLPDDVVLVPVQITNRKPPDADLLRLVAVKSPDFAPRHQSGFASDPLIKMHETTVETSLQAIDQGRMKLSQDLDRAKLEATTQSNKEIRGFWSRFSHWRSGTDDGMISQARKDFYTATVIPFLSKAAEALNSNADTRIEDMKKALLACPTDKQLAAFGSDEGKRMKDTLIALKQSLQKQIVDQEAAVELRQCKDAMGRKDLNGMFDALPENGKWSQSSRAQSIAQVRSDIVDMHKAIPPKMTEEQRAKLQKRFDEQSPVMIKRIETSLDALEKMKTKEDGLEAFVNKARVVQKEIDLLKSEKTRCSADPSTVDLSAINALEARLHHAALVRCSNLSSSLNMEIGYVRTVANYEKSEELLARRMEIMGNLERLMGTTDKDAPRVRSFVQDLKKDYAALQQAYPQAVELDFKADQLVSRLRSMCNEKLAGLTPPTRGDDAYYLNTIWATLMGDSEDFIARKAAYNSLMSVKNLLNDPSKSSAQILNELAGKPHKNLVEAIGITETQAERLESCWDALAEDPLSNLVVMGELSERDRGASLAKAIDEVDQVIASIDGTEAPVQVMREIQEPDQRMELR